MHDDDDRQAFADATRDVKPLKASDRVPRARPRPKALARHSRDERRAAIRDSLAGEWHESVNGEVEFRRSTVSPRMFRDLRRGRFSVEAELDLHGMTRAQAEVEIKEFIARCIERRLGCVRVVHGKGTRSGPGGPVLKNLAHEILARTDEVLAYTSAVTRYGGSGAVCVLLRSR